MLLCRNAVGLPVGMLLTISIAAPAQPVPESEPLFSFQWGLHNIGQDVEGVSGPEDVDVDAPEAWAIHSGASPVIVAVVGTGVNPHIEFADRLLPGYATVGDPYDTRDPCSHGTHTAGIIGAASDNTVGIAGLMDHALILPVRVVDDCVGTSSTASAAATGIIWAVDQGAQIVIVPLKFFPGTESLEDAVAYAITHGVLVIAPTGDTGHAEVAFPGAYDGCLAISATDRYDTLASLSNYGLETDLSAPGENILSTWGDETWDYRSSTPAAAAFTAGVAALLLSYAPHLTAAEIEQILIDSSDDLGDPGWDPQFGAGRLNAERALQLAPAPALRFEHLERPPTTVLPGSSPSFAVRVASVDEAVVDGSVGLFYRLGSGDFSYSSASALGDGLFLFTLPALSCGWTASYYLSAHGERGTVVCDPLTAPASVYRAEAIRSKTIFADDFEEEQEEDWTSVPSPCSSPTTGCWTRVVPVGTSAQPGFDFSPNAGQYCFVTGQHLDGGDGTNDVDGGPVQLLSPVISLDAPDAEISYARWFHSSVGTPDELIVELSRDAGVSWVLVETVTTTDMWKLHAFRLSAFPEAIGNELQVRFTTQDPPSGPSLTEAAIDEFRVQAIQCSSGTGDFDGDGRICLADFGHLFGCMAGPMIGFEPHDDPCGLFDFDGDKDVDIDDFQAFQTSFVSELD